MKYSVTSRDKRLMQQKSLYYRYRLMVIDKEKNIIDMLTGMSELSSYAIDSESKIRRTCSIILQLDNEYRTKSLDKKIATWLGFDFYIQIGIYDIREDNYIWYDCGYYVISESNTSYNAIENTLTCTLSDWWANFDGTRNGQIGGAIDIVIPNTKSITDDIYLIRFVPVKGKEKWKAFRYIDTTDSHGNKVSFLPDSFNLSDYPEFPSNLYSNEFFHFYEEDKEGKYVEFLKYSTISSYIGKDYNEKKDYNKGLSNSNGTLNYEDKVQFAVSFQLNDDRKISFSTKSSNGGQLYLYTRQINETTAISFRGDMQKSDENGIVKIEIPPNIESVDIYNGWHSITMKESCISILESATEITDYIIEDVGEYKGMPQFYDLYEDYRLTNPEWNALPFELSYKAGSTVGDILDELCEIYPHTQMYFDIFGFFCYDTVPTMENEPVLLDNEFIQSVLLSEQSEQIEYDISAIKNVTEVWGSTYDVDRTSTSTTLSDETYAITLEKYEAYQKGELIAFTPKTTNKAKTYVKINSLGKIPLYKEYTTDFIDAGLLKKDEIYVIEIWKDSFNGKYIAYYLGQFQPHALCVLSDNADDEKYTKDYFIEKYNCLPENVIIRIEPGSPFSIQKLGEVLDVKTGEEFDNILSDSIAVTNAIHHNKKSSSWQDTVTLNTKMIPWLDVNIKVAYKKQQEQEEMQYVIQSIDNSGVLSSSVVMYRFYPMYYL